MKTFELKIGVERLVLDSDMFTWKVIRTLRTAVDQHREEYIKLVNAPLDEINKLDVEFGEKMKKLETETDDAYNERMKPITVALEAKVKKINTKYETTERGLIALAIPILVELGKIGEQAHKVTPEGVESAPWYTVRKYIFDVLKFCGLGLYDAFDPEK